MGNIVDYITKNTMGDLCSQSNVDWKRRSPLKRSQRKYKHKKQHLSAHKKKGKRRRRASTSEIERKYNKNEKHITNASFMDIIDFVNNSSFSEIDIKHNDCFGDDDYYDINYKYPKQMKPIRFKLRAQKVQKMKDETRISIQSTLSEASNQELVERVSIFYEIRNRSNKYKHKKQHLSAHKKKGKRRRKYSRDVVDQSALTINYWDINKNEKHITNASFMDIIDFVNNSANNTPENNINNNKYPEISSVHTPKSLIMITPITPIPTGPTLYRFEFIFLEDIYKHYDNIYYDNNQLEVTRARYDEYIHILCKYIYIYNLFIFQVNLSHDLYQELQYLLAQNGGNLDKLKKIKIYQQFVNY